ncbi:hypothetical protein ABT297_07310 [Dactylosporangium sp. NPDC000555]|uniref:hypothetical protein n=1 Tax=Dactylosporangium sp. NPDC000555 TaxID=3154260 RepID=UPI0033171659
MFGQIVDCLQVVASDLLDASPVERLRGSHRAIVPYAGSPYSVLDELQALYAHCLARAAISEPLALQSWGLHDFRLIDPDGYYVRVTHGNAAAGFDPAT